MSQHRKPAFAISKKILKKIVSHLYPLMTRKKNRRNIYYPDKTLATYRQNTCNSKTKHLQQM